MKKKLGVLCIIALIIISGFVISNSVSGELSKTIINPTVYGLDIFGNDELVNTIAVVNDLHIIASDENAKDNTADLSEIDDDKKDDVSARYNNFSYAEDTSTQEMLSTIIEYLNAEENQIDLVIFAGDMLDSLTKKNAEILKDGLSELEIPYIYLRADHDTEPFYSSLYTVDEAHEISNNISESRDVFVTQMEGYKIIGWNNSTSVMSAEGLQSAKEALESEEPIIVVTHVPIDISDDADMHAFVKSRDPQERLLIWGNDCYYEPDENTREFLDMVLSDDYNVRGIISGHLHKEYMSYIGDDPVQYILDPSFEGVVSVFNVY